MTQKTPGKRTSDGYDLQAKVMVDKILELFGRDIHLRPFAQKLSRDDVTRIASELANKGRTRNLGLQGLASRLWPTMIVEVGRANGVTIKEDMLPGVALDESRGVDMLRDVLSQRKDRPNDKAP